MALMQPTPSAALRRAQPSREIEQRPPDMPQTDHSSNAALLGQEELRSSVAAQTEPSAGSPPSEFDPKPTILVTRCDPSLRRLISRIGHAAGLSQEYIVWESGARWIGRLSGYAGWIVGVQTWERAADHLRLGRRLRAELELLAVGAHDEAERAQLLAAGADHVLTTSDHLDVITETTRVFVRRATTAFRRDTVRVGDVALDRRSQRVWCHGKALRFTPRQFRMIECLLLNAGRTVTPAELRDYMWVYRGLDRPSRNGVEVQIGAVRRLLRGSTLAGIRTVRREGYVLEVHADATAASID